MPGSGGGNGGAPEKAPRGGIPGKAGGTPHGIIGIGGVGTGGVGTRGVAYVWGVATYMALWFVSARAGTRVLWAPVRALCTSNLAWSSSSESGWFSIFGHLGGGCVIPITSQECIFNVGKTE